VRVLYLNPFSQQVSGPDESLLALLAGLVPLGVEPHVVLPAPGPQVSRYEAAGAKVEFAPLAILRRGLSFGAAAYPVRLARSTIAVARMARQSRADLIHTNMEVLLEGGLAARLCGIPHVLHYRGNTLDRPKVVFDALAKTWTSIADQVFCISRATAEIFFRRGYRHHVDVLYNPVDLSRFEPGRADPAVRAALGATERQTLVGTVSRIHPRKDLETFLRAAADIAANAADVRFAVVGAAEGPAEQLYLSRLMALVRELGMEDRIVFAGARRDVADVMRAIDVFVLTSRHEGFGRVVAEAMATRKPIVVTDEGAPPELVERGRFGLCAPAADPPAFARAVLELIRDPVRAAAIADGAVQAARQFDAPAVAARVYERYQSLIRRSPDPQV
jgi:glycosyltransferase involved in cell wall biosynthesis